MKLTMLASAVAADDNYDGTLPPEYNGQNEAIVQIEITNTATVIIQGRVSSAFSWVELISVKSVNTLQPITYMPEIRAVVDWTSGTVSVGVLTG